MTDIVTTQLIISVFGFLGSVATAVIALFAHRAASSAKETAEQTQATVTQVARDVNGNLSAIKQESSKFAAEVVRLRGVAVVGVRAVRVTGQCPGGTVALA